MTARIAQFWMRWHRWILPALALLAVLVPDLAEARVGGGQNYSGGSSSGSGGGGFSGGSSGGGGDLSGLLFWLLVKHPAIGVPVVIVVIAVVVVKKYSETQGGFGRSPVPTSRVVRRDAPRGRSDAGIVAIQQRDPGFSEVLLVDFFQLLYVRGRKLGVPGADRGPLRPWFTDQAQGQLQLGRRLSSVDDVVFGAVRAIGVLQVKNQDRLTIEVEANLIATATDGSPRHVLRRERWVLARAAGVTSPGPDRMRALGCAACGAVEEPRPTGECPACGQPRLGGALQWIVDEVRILEDRNLGATEVHLGGGIEPGYHRPDVLDPELALHKREFLTRHPDHEWRAFEARVERTFRALQAAWSAGSFASTRALQSDNLFQVHRFWLDRYARDGLRNRLEDVEVQCVRLVRIGRDAWYETVVVRIFAQMRDWTERVDSGELVGGSKTDPRVFSEYWTFVRAIGAQDRAADHDEGECPACGAPLDKLSMAGVCGYCEAKITTGDFDWVLSRIEQDEAYRG
jgi:hypothetical protein